MFKIDINILVSTHFQEVDLTNKTFPLQSNTLNETGNTSNCMPDEGKTRQTLPPSQDNAIVLLCHQQAQRSKCYFIQTCLQFLAL